MTQRTIQLLPIEDSNCGFVISSSVNGSWTSAKNGANRTAYNASSTNQCGDNYVEEVNETWTCSQMFWHWNFSGAIPSGSVIVSAEFDASVNEVAGTGSSDRFGPNWMEMYDYNYGTLAATDFRSEASLDSLYGADKLMASRYIDGTGDGYAVNGHSFVNATIFSVDQFVLKIQTALDAGETDTKFLFAGNNQRDNNPPIETDNRHSRWGQFDSPNDPSVAAHIILTYETPESPMLMGAVM
jgi:hypothetical protein